MLVKISVLLAFIALYVGYSRADTPANCTYDDVVGTWTFYESERGHSSSVDCGTISKAEGFASCCCCSAAKTELSDFRKLHTSIAG